MLRAVIIITLVAIYLIITLPLVLVGFIIGLFSPKTRYKIAMVIARFASNSFFILSGAKIQVSGLENIPKDNSGILFVGNHRSIIDIPLMLKYAPYPLAFIAKLELKKMPLLNIVMILLGCLFMDRNNLRQSIHIIKLGIKKLEQQEAMLIFPEGTRSKEEEMLPFKQGSLKLAEKANVPIIPFAVRGTEEVFGKYGFKVKPRNIYLNIGTPIDLNQLNDNDKKTSANYTREIIKELYNQLPNS